MVCFFFQSVRFNVFVGGCMTIPRPKKKKTTTCINPTQPLGGNRWELRLSWSKPLGPKRPLGANIKASDTSSQPGFPPVPGRGSFQDVPMTPKNPLKSIAFGAFSGGSLTWNLESSSRGWDIYMMYTCSWHLHFIMLCGLSNPCFFLRGTSTRIRVPPENKPPIIERTHYTSVTRHQTTLTNCTHC